LFFGCNFVKFSQGSLHRAGCGRRILAEFWRPQAAL
jgi:hypothetical protein